MKEAIDDGRVKCGDEMAIIEIKKSIPQVRE